MEDATDIGLTATTVPMSISHIAVPKKLDMQAAGPLRRGKAKTMVGKTGDRGRPGSAHRALGSARIGLNHEPASSNSQPKSTKAKEKAKNLWHHCLLLHNGLHRLLCLPMWTPQPRSPVLPRLRMLCRPCSPFQSPRTTKTKWS